MEAGLPSADIRNKFEDVANIPKLKKRLFLRAGHLVYTQKRQFCLS